MARRYDMWTPQRLALASLLRERGQTLAEIAAHPRIRSTAEAVSKKFDRMGIRVSKSLDDAIRIPSACRAAFEAAGRARQMTPEGVAREAIRVLGQDKSLLDNVLDDGVQTK